MPWPARTDHCRRTDVSRSLGDGAAAFEGAAEGDLVRVFEVTADRQSGSEARDLDADGLQHPHEVGGRGFALEVRIGGDDDFLNLVIREPALQFPDTQLIGTDPRDWID